MIHYFQLEIYTELAYLYSHNLTVPVIFNITFIYIVIEFQSRRNEFIKKRGVSQLKVSRQSRHLKKA
jgi:hypothetical protein